MPDPSIPLLPRERKVLFVTPVAPWSLFGGTATVSRNLIEILSESLDMNVCCLRSNEPGAYPCTMHGANVLTGAVPSLARRLKFFFDRSDASFAHRQFQKSNVRQRFAALLAEQRPEAIIFDHIFSSWLIDLVSTPATKVIYIAHDDMVAYADSLLRLRPGFLKRLRFAGLRSQYQSLQEKVLQRCDYTLTMTPEDAALLRRAGRGPAEVAPLFFDLPETSRDYGRDFHSLLVTGSFDTWEKKLGLTQFLETIFFPIQKRRLALRLVVTGRIPNEVRRQMPTSEPSLEIVHAPSAAQMHGLIRQASAAVVLDLQASGLKIKTIELAASGLPLVSWAPGLEGTGLIHGESCLRAASAPEFIAHLDRLCSEPELRRRLGTAARQTVQARFCLNSARAHLRASHWFEALSGAGAQRAIG
jgi:glycosyltransferase involved in cell wall biosynthesis